MSLHTLANHMAQTGRGPDSMLVHMSPREVNGLQALAKANGGSLTINPHTGLPEAGFLDSLLPMILGIALAPETGGASLGITSAWETAAVVGGLTGLATGSLSKGLMAGFGAYGGAGIGGSLANAGVNQIAAEELVKQNVLNPADATGLGAPTSVSTLTPSAETLARSNGSWDVPGNTTPQPYSTNTVVETGMAPANSAWTPPAPTGMPGPGGEFESVVGNAPNQMTPEAYAKMASKSMTPEQFAAAKQQMIEGIKNGTVNPMSSLGKGIQGLTDTGGWGQFAKSNMVPIGMAASQALLSQPQNTLRTPQQATGGYHTGYYDPVTHQYVNTGGYIPYADWGDKNIRDYTHAKNGGLMGLANGGAVAFADGGGINMFSPYVDLLANPEKSGFVAGAERDAYMKDIQAKQDELNQRMIDRQTAGGGTAQPINWQQSPSGLNPSITQPKTQADIARDTDLANQWAAIGNPFTAGGGETSTADYNRAVAVQTAKTNAENAAQDAYQISPDSPFYAASKVATGDRLNNLKEQAYEFQKRQENLAKLAAANPGEEITSSGPNNEGYSYGASKFGVTSKDYLPNVKTNMPDTPAASGAPMDRAKAQGIQTLAQPDTAAVNAPAVNAPAVNAPAVNAPAIASAPSGVQQLIKDQHLVDPTTGHLVNPNLSTAQLAETKNNMLAMKAAYDSYWNTVKPGDVLDFAGGTLTMNADGTATHKYTDANGKPQSYTFDKGTDFSTVAKADPNIAQEWKSMFNYVPASGTGGPGVATQVPTGWTPPVAPPTRVPTSIEDFNKRFNTLSDDNKALYDYLMAEPGAKEPKQTQNTEVAAPYWEKMGMAPVNTKRSSRIYDPTVKNAAGKVVGGYVANPNFVPKVMDPVTKRMVDAVTATDDEKNKPTTVPDKNKEWTWSKDKKQWLQTDVVTPVDSGSNGIARGGAINYATGGLGSLGGYSDGGQLLRGDGDGVSDSIPASIGNRQPARLADGEFVVPARIVSELGNGSTEAGARRLYQMMDRVQGARKKSIGKDKVATNSRADKYLPA